MHNAEIAHAHMTAAALRVSGPILAEAVKAGQVKVVAARFDLDSGRVELLPELANPEATNAETAHPAPAVPNGSAHALSTHKHKINSKAVLDFSPQPKSLRDLATFGARATLESVAGRRSRYVTGGIPISSNRWGIKARVHTSNRCEHPN